MDSIAAPSVAATPFAEARCQISGAISFKPQRGRLLAALALLHHRQAILPSLLASTMAAILVGRRASNPVS